jgi:hypothetical protein
MPAIAPHTTPVSNAAWNASANVAKISNDAGAATLRLEYAWIDPDKDAATKAAYKFPHHMVDGNGQPGAANLAGCRNGLARLDGSSIPDTDKAGVRAHLQHHLDSPDNPANQKEQQTEGAEREMPEEPTETRVPLEPSTPVRGFEDWRL